jgi:hypothetical protein
VNEASILKQCDCPLECDTHGYEYSVTASEYPTLDYAKTKINDNRFLKSLYPNFSSLLSDSKVYLEFSKSVCGANIFYDSLTQTTTSYDPKVTITDLVSSIGGTLGLFLGMSFLSFMAIAEILVQSLIIVCCVKRPVRTAKLMSVSKFSLVKRNHIV